MTAPIAPPTTCKIEIIPIYNDIHSALVIYGSATAEQHYKHSMRRDNTWDEDNHQICVSYAFPGRFNLVLKVGGNIDLRESLSKHGFKLVDDLMTEVRTVSW